MLRASRTGTDILGTEKGGRAGCRCLYKKREVFQFFEDLSFFGRDERIRTFDLHVPNVAREPDCATSRFKSDAKIINYPDAIQTSEDFFSWGPFFLLLVCCREGTPLRGRGMPADAGRVCSGRDTGKEDTDRQSVRIIRRFVVRFSFSDRETGQTTVSSKIRGIPVEKSSRSPVVGWMKQSL